MAYSVSILADSISPYGYRLTTFETTFPRFILAEWNTHRVFSRNSASSRAIPTETQIELVTNNPFIPEFNERVKGMGVGNLLSEKDQQQAKEIWLKARDNAVAAATSLLHVDKSRANRLLEPFMWQTVITTSTTWGNFFALRTSKDAQPEFIRIASMMKEAYETYEPKELKVGEAHLPLVSDEDKEKYNYELFEVSSGRCAKVSYGKHGLKETAEKSIERHRKLISKGHWSPTEHQAVVMPSVESAARFNGNLEGDWAQFRKSFSHEEDYNCLV